MPAAHAAVSGRARRAVLLATLTALLTAGCSDDKKADGPTPSPSTTATTSVELVDAGLSLLEQGQQDAALAAFNDAATQDPQNHFAHYNVGVILQGRGDSQGALSAYGRALTAKPDYVPALFNEAILFTATDPALAITTYRRVIALQPKAPTAYLNLGLLEARLGQLPAAKRSLTTALTQDPALRANIPPDVARRVGLPAPAPRPSSS